MGAELFDRYPAMVAAADEALGQSLRELCLHDSERKLNRTELTQPCMFAVTAMAWTRWREQAGEDPLALAGHSLGEYAALYAAGVFDFPTGMRLVCERGRLMGSAREGAMAAIVGMRPERVDQRLREHGYDSLTIANFNSREQAVIAGPSDAIVGAASVFGDEGVRYIRLNVSAAFHSSLMDDASREYARLLRGVSLDRPALPVVANLTARVYPGEPEDIRELLAAQISWPVRWYESVSKLLACPDAEIEEVGPGNTLTRMLVHIRRDPMAVEVPSWGRLPELEPRRPEPELPARTKPAPSRPLAEPELPARPEPAPSRPLAQPERGQLGQLGPRCAVVPRGGRIFAYTGHGSQYYRMGEGLYREQGRFRAVLDGCFAQARRRLPCDLAQVVFEEAEPFDPFDRVLFSTPALFSLGVALAGALVDAGIVPDAALGYGIGEWLAATSAGAISVSEGLELALDFAELLEAHAPVGAMLAVFDPPASFVRSPELFAGCELAGLDFAQHFIVSGATRDIDAAAQRARERGVVTQRLPIHYALHSSALDALEYAFMKRARALSYAPLRLPLYSPTARAWVDQVDAGFMWRAVRAQVDFVSALEQVERHAAMLVDLGPSGTLAGFVRHHFDTSERAVAALNRFGRDLSSLSRLEARLAPARAEIRL